MTDSHVVFLGSQVGLGLHLGSDRRHELRLGTGFLVSFLPGSAALAWSSSLEYLFHDGGHVALGFQLNWEHAAFPLRDADGADLVSFNFVIGIE